MRLQNPQVVGHIPQHSPRRHIVGNVKFLVTLQFILMLTLIFWMAVSIYLEFNSSSQQEVVGKISELELGQQNIMDQLESSTDVEVVEDAERLLNKATESTLKVFQQVEDGDYFIFLANNQVLVYRPSSQQVVYAGEDADQLRADFDRKLGQEVTEAAVKSDILDTEYQNDLPLLEEIKDISELLRQDSSFFSSGDNGDYIAYYPRAKVALIYNPQRQQIMTFATWEYNVVQ